jgi:hypothetical protein
MCDDDPPHPKVPFALAPAIVIEGVVNYTTATISTLSVLTMCVAQRHNDEAEANEEGEIMRRR